MQKIKADNKGFTLIELLIAMFVFSLLVLAISAVYVAFSQTQARTKASQQLLNDSQYSLEVMAREIRNTTIFDFTPTPAECNAILDTGYDDCILLLREDGQLVSFAREANAVNRLWYVVFDCNTDYSACTWDEYTESALLLDSTLNNAEVEELDFDISPSVSPYDGASDQQPRVTIRLATTSSSDHPNDQVSHLLQTTVSSRLYKR